MRWPNGKLEKLLDILLAISHIYQDIHANGILYNDPKLGHFGWSSKDKALFIIDWNFSKIVDSNIPESWLKFDLIKLGDHVFSKLIPDDNPEIDDTVDLAELRKICGNLMLGKYTKARNLHQDISIIMKDI